VKRLDEMADIIEFRTWAAAKPVTQSALVDQLDSALDADDKSNSETLAQNILDEFQSRQGKLGGKYPFKTDGYKLELADSDPAATTYLFCLGLSLLPSSRIAAKQRTRFEVVVLDAASSFFGAEGIRIGAPWKSADTPSYGVLLDKITGLIPNLGQKMKTKAPQGGDAGWDVLVVKNFCDGQFPRLIALGNCATGRTDWLKKGTEAEPALFWSYFQGSHRSALLTFFAVPFLMDEEDRLRKYCEHCLTFDRYRICQHAPTTKIAETASWLKKEKGNALKIPLN
jgi:hypothetical protein